MKNKKETSSIGFFKRLKNVFERVFSYFKGFNTLVIMQLKDRLNLSFKADKKGSLTKMVLLLLLFGALVAVIVVIFTILNKLGVLGSTGYVPVSMFNVIFFLILLLNIVSCIARMTNALFFSEDNQVLLSYPVKANTIFLSKLVVFYVVELVKSFAIIIPLIVGYAITYRFSFVFYPWLVICFLVVALVPIAIASILCIPYMYIKMFFKKFQFIQGTVFLIALVAITVLIFRVVNLLPEDLHIATWWSTKYFPAIVNFTQMVEKYLLPLVFISTMVFGYQINSVNNPKYLTFVTGRAVGAFAIILGVCLLALLLSYLLAKPLFFSMASKPFEYKINKNQTKDIYEQAIVPIYDHQLSKKEQEEEIKKLNRFLRKLNREEKLFLKRNIDIKRVVRFLKKYSKRSSEKGIPFEIVPIEEFKAKELFGYIIQIRNNVPSLVLVKKFKFAYMDCYDPNYLAKKNHKMNAFISTLFKDILVEFRTPGSILSNFLMFIVTPLAVLVLNSIFAAMKTSTDGEMYTIIFNVLIISMIICATNVAISSIYSREGSASYLLKITPTNLMKSLATKLIIRTAIVTASLIFTMFIYSSKCSLDHVRFDLLFFAFLFIYLGHLLWSAELDYMNPQDRLYAEVGQQQGNVSNPNETLSSILSLLIPIVFTAIVFFFYDENPITSFRKIFFVALLFFVARLILFVLKIVGYGTSRNERTAN